MDLNTCTCTCNKEFPFYVEPFCERKYFVGIEQ